MMSKGMTYVLAGLLLCQLQVAAQSKKEIREKNIESVTVEEYFLEEGMNEPVIESVEKFDEQGELIERKELNKLGEIKRWEKYAYDEDGNLVEEVFLDEKGKVESIERNIYRDGLRVEKQYFDHRERMVKKKVYVYGYRK